KEQVPLSKPSPYSKRWWTKELSNMRKAKNRLNALSYRLREDSGHPIHEEAKQCRKQYSDRILETKEEHWKQWLENATEHDIWIANRYISSSGGEGSRTRIPTMKAQEDETPVTSNAEKSKLLMASFFPPPPD